MENTFKVGETVKVKRTSGKWEEGKIHEVFPFGVMVKVKITDNFRGKPYGGLPKNGYKLIKNERFETHLLKLSGVQ